MNDASRSAPRNNPQPAVQPKPARGVKIAIGVAVGLLALVTLAVWGLFRVFAG